MQLLLPAMAVIPKTCLRQIPAMVHHEAETENADEEFDYEFADVSDHREKCMLIMNKVLNMNEEEYKAYRKNHPWPSEFTYPSINLYDGL